MCYDFDVCIPMRSEINQFSGFEAFLFPSFAPSYLVDRRLMPVNFCLVEIKLPWYIVCRFVFTQGSPWNIDSYYGCHWPGTVLWNEESWWINRLFDTERRIRKSIYSPYSKLFCLFFLPKASNQDRTSSMSAIELEWRSYFDVALIIALALGSAWKLICVHTTCYLR